MYTLLTTFRMFFHPTLSTVRVACFLISLEASSRLSCFICDCPYSSERSVCLSVHTSICFCEGGCGSVDDMIAMSPATVTSSDRRDHRKTDIPKVMRPKSIFLFFSFLFCSLGVLIDAWWTAKTDFHQPVRTPKGWSPFFRDGQTETCCPTCSHRLQWQTDGQSDPHIAWQTDSLRL